MKIFLLSFLLAFTALAETQPKWIWSTNDASSVILYKQIKVSKWIAYSRVYAAGDDEFTLYIDGKEILSGGNTEPAFQLLEVGKDIQKDATVDLVIKAVNNEQDAGAFIELVFERYDGRPNSIVTDNTWKSQTVTTDWSIEDFKASDTDPEVKVLASLGEKPWEKVDRQALKKASGEKAPSAPKPETMKIREGFQVELLYTVPKKTQGSWVSLAVDPDGNLYSSNQYGALYKTTLDKGKISKIEEVKLDIGHSQGLLYAFDSLYVTVSDKKHGGRGVYRLLDTNKDGNLDKKVLVKKFVETGREHGIHSLALAPDGKSIYIVNGNQTPLFEQDHSRAPKVWKNDNLLPAGFSDKPYFRNVKEPAGWISKFSPDGKEWETIAVGLRNPYDIAFNKDGDLFTYDADMELDLGGPWYRPTRICLVNSGAEFGWRNGTGKWPARWEDSVDGIHNIGVGSPTGIAFGYGANMPEVYQNSLFICDWSYGKLYSVQMAPNGSSYKCQPEEIIAGQPLPLTDIVVNPVDKAIYFTVGGRRVQSGLYRLTWNGQGKLPETLAAGNDLRSIRHELEEFHKPSQGAVEKAWPYLDHQDRFIRFAARTAIEHQAVSQWQQKVFSESKDSKKIYAAIALIRCADYSLEKVIDLLRSIDWNTLQRHDKLALARAYSLALSRKSKDSSVPSKQIAEHIAKVFPSNDEELNDDLLELLVFIEDSSAIQTGLKLLKEGLSQEEQISYVMSLRHIKNGWTTETREEFFKWFGKAQNFPGGAPLSSYITNMAVEILNNMPQSEHAKLKQLIIDGKDKPVELSGPPRSFVKLWSMSDFKDLEELNTALDKPRDLTNGKILYSQTACISCHRFKTSGGLFGPDLTSVRGKFSAHDLLTQIIEPSLEISDQYNSMIFEKKDGSMVTGRIVDMGASFIEVNTDMANPKARVKLDRRFVKSMKNNPVSMMPPGLLSTLTKEDIYDLLAYLLKSK